jgi:hypothetical protein
MASERVDSLKFRYAPLKKYVSDISGLRAELAAMRSTLVEHEKQIKGLQQQTATVPRRGVRALVRPDQEQHPPWSDPNNGGSRWRTHLVMVVATLNGQLKPEDMRWAQNTSRLTTVLYQRVDPHAPNYSPNFGFEAGVHIQFILENYHDLPNQTLFLQDGPATHNPQWHQWLGCLREDAQYAPFVLRREMRKGLDEWDLCCNADALVEQCFRDTLAIFNLSRLLPPRQRPAIGYYPGEMYLASATQLRRHPRAAYAAMHAMTAGGDGRCHAGPLQWELLNTSRRADTLAFDSPGMSKHTSGGAWEHLQHIIVGGFGRHQPSDIAKGEGLFAPYSFNFCHAFKPYCEGSPCDIFRKTPLGRRTLVSEGLGSLVDRLPPERKRLVGGRRQHRHTKQGK